MNCSSCEYKYLCCYRILYESIGCNSYKPRTKNETKECINCGEKIELHLIDKEGLCFECWADKVKGGKYERNKSIS